MDLFFKYAMDEAKIGLKEGGIPIGSILVRNRSVLVEDTI